MTTGRARIDTAEKRSRSRGSTDGQAVDQHAVLDRGATIEHVGPVLVAHRLARHDLDRVPRAPMRVAKDRHAPSAPPAACGP